MRIEVKGRNLRLPEDFRELVARRFRVIERQVPELASLEVELLPEHGHETAGGCVAEAALQLRGVTLRASAHADDPKTAVNLVSEELAVQVKRDRDKRRRRREARAAEVLPRSPRPAA